jgi:transketolase
MTDAKLQGRAINAIRFLSADAIQKANSGHPGMPMGAAAMAYTLWTRHLRFNPNNPKWWNRVLFFQAGMGQCYCILYCTSRDMMYLWRI